MEKYAIIEHEVEMRTKEERRLTMEKKLEFSDEVLDKMGKPSSEVYLKFVKKYEQINKKLGKNQYLVPYLISSHPGCDLKSAIKLTEYLMSINHMPEQVQDFYPTPGTISTCMFYTGIDPRNMKKVYVPKSKEEKQMQRALLQYRKKENFEIIKKALIKANREDLIGKIRMRLK